MSVAPTGFAIINMNVAPTDFVTTQKALEVNMVKKSLLFSCSYYIPMPQKYK